MSVIDLSKCFPLALDGTQGPLPKQAQFMNLALDPNGPKFVSYYGGYGSGKSLILCVTNIMWGVLHGGEYVIARQFMPELRRTTMQVFKDMLPKELLIEERVADAQFRIRSMKGEAKFHFVGLDEPGKLDSLNLSGASIDEASQASEEAMLKLQGRLRNPKGLRKMLLVGNPKGHDFVYKYFVSQNCFVDHLDPVTKRQVTVEEQKARYKMIIAPSTENKHLPPDYVSQMLSSYSKERIQRDIMGSFDAFQGQIYTEFNRALHIIPPRSLPKTWTRIMGLDHGYRNPAAALWLAIDPDDNAYVYREFYKREQLIEQICKGDPRTGEPGLATLSKGEKLDGCFADPSIRRTQGQTGESDWDVYLEHLPRTFPLVPANNDVALGIDRVKSFLKPNERTGKPRLYIFDNCTNLIEEISTYRWKEQLPGQVGQVNEKEEPVKNNDHACDALRYALMSRPEGPRPDKERQEAARPRTASYYLQQELKALKTPKQRDPFGDL